MQCSTDFWFNWLNWYSEQRVRQDDRASAQLLLLVLREVRLLAIARSVQGRVKSRTTAVLGYYGKDSNFYVYCFIHTSRKTLYFSEFSHSQDWMVWDTEFEVAVWTRYMYWSQFTLKKINYYTENATLFKGLMSLSFFSTWILFLHSQNTVFHWNSLLRFRILHVLIIQNNR